MGLVKAATYFDFLNGFFVLCFIQQSQGHPIAAGDDVHNDSALMT